MPPRRSLNATAGASSTSSCSSLSSTSRARSRLRRSFAPSALPPSVPDDLPPPSMRIVETKSEVQAKNEQPKKPPPSPPPPPLRPPPLRPPKPQEKATPHPNPTTTNSTNTTNTVLLPRQNQSTKNPSRAALPSRELFDPWNSLSIGHQRAENTRLQGSTSWRESRTRKLAAQFADTGGGGGERLFDSVGAGSEHFGRDGRTANGGWVKGAAGLRAKGQMSIVEAMKARCGKPTAASSVTRKEGLEGKRKSASWESELGANSAASAAVFSPADDTFTGNTRVEENAEPALNPIPPQIFAGTTIYINGSTHPVISDHRLKQLLVSHGARLSIALGRRTVTHVILGRTNSHGGCGGGLAGSKLQKEISTIRGKGVKFVGVEWVVDSLKAGRRLPEARFRVMEMAGERQRSVFDMLLGQ